MVTMIFYKEDKQSIHITKYSFNLIHDDGFTYIGDIELEETNTFDSRLDFIRINFKRTFTGQANFDIIKEIIKSYNKGDYHLLDDGILLGKYNLLDLYYPTWKEIGFPKIKMICN